MQQAKNRNLEFLNNSSNEFNRILGRNFLLNNDTHLNYTPEFRNQRSLSLNRSGNSPNFTGSLTASLNTLLAVDRMTNRFETSVYTYIIIFILCI